MPEKQNLKKMIRVAVLLYMSILEEENESHKYTFNENNLKLLILFL